MTDKQAIALPLGDSKAKNLHGLTMKQEAMVRLMADGVPMIESYKRAYSIGELKPHHKVDAARVANGSAFQRRLKALSRMVMDEMVNDAVAIRKVVIEGLLREQNPEFNSSPAARVAALVNLGKLDIVDMFTAKGAEKKERDSAEVEAELRGLLARMKALD